MKHLLSLSVLLALSLASFSQTTDKKSNYEAYIEARRNAFKAYVDERNARYILFMKQRWREADIFAADAEKPQPAPVIPTIAPQTQDPHAEPVTTEPERQPVPTLDTPTAPDKDSGERRKPSGSASANTEAGTFAFTFFGTDCRIPRLNMGRPMLADCLEESVAALWQQFAEAGYASVIDGCAELKRSLRLNDWGYLQLLTSLAETWYTPRSVEAVLLRTFLAVQSGYEVRIAQSSGHLVMLFPCDEQIYRRRFVSLGGKRFYMFDALTGNSKCRVFDRAFGGDKMVSLFASESPALADRPSKVRTLASEKYPDMKIDAVINMNLIDYFDAYPNCDLEIYRRLDFSGEILERLAVMKKILAGHSEKEAVAMILNFVQTAFGYKTDGEQFGYERSFFAEETIYYPYCDCEDRAILFSALVEKLLGLDTVLLQYPGHVATAVRLSESQTGNYVTVGGKRYTICDPTFIGAGIGRSMPGLDSSHINIVRN